MQRGNGLDIMSLKNTSPAFKEAYEPFSPEGKAKVKQAADNFKKEEEFQAAREKKNAANQKLDEDIARTQANARDAAVAEHKQGAKNQFRAFLRQGKSDAGIRKDVKTENDNRQQRQQISNVQDEAAMQGFRMSPQQALQIVNQRKAEQKALEHAEAQAMSTILDGQGNMMSQIQMWRQVGKQAEQMNRSNVSSGNGGVLTQG